MCCLDSPQSNWKARAQDLQEGIWDSEKDVVLIKVLAEWIPLC